jgi:hypothetical protein
MQLNLSFNNLIRSLQFKWIVFLCVGFLGSTFFIQGLYEVECKLYLLGQIEPKSSSKSILLGFKLGLRFRPSIEEST